MATYYLVASGNWSNPAIWSLTSGGSGGAGVPDSGDTASTYRNPSSNFTLNVDTPLNGVRLWMSAGFNGSVNMGSHTHVMQNIQADSGNLNLQSSDISTNGFSKLQTGVLNINPGTSIVRVNGTGQVTGLASSVLNFATLIINPSFVGVMRNIFANTIVATEEGGSGNIGVAQNESISVRKLIVKKVGSNRFVQSIPNIPTSVATINFVGSNQIISGYNLLVRGINASGSGNYYAGSNSVDGGRNSGWIFSDAPSVNTLVDPFNGSTINTTRWTVNGSALSQTGGKLQFTAGSGVTTSTITSREQFLGEGSSIKFKAEVNVGSLTAYFAIASLQYGVTARRNIPDIYLFLSSTEGRFYINANSNYTSLSFNNDYSYYQIRESGGTLYLDGSTDGIAYTNIKSAVGATYGLDTTQLVARPNFAFYSDTAGIISLDDFNVELEPTAQFTQSGTTGTTPLTVNFTDQSNFAPTNWSWNFGDSTTSTLQNPTKTYNAPGTYTVSLTSSKTGTSRSVTKTDLITVSPNVYSRSISGTLLFGGGASRKINASRSISGTLLFGGGVRAVVLRDVEGLQDKRYLYKVYDPDGNYIEVWKDVISELTYTHEMNTIGSTTTVELARNSDTLGTSTSPLQAEDGTNLLTEDDFDILVTTTSRNQIGSGSSVDYNNRVDISVFYGSVEPLLTEMGEEILTEDDEELLADIGAPNGRVLFTGFISEINSRYGGSETTIVQLTSYGWDLDQFPITTSGGATTVPFNSYDPSNIAIEAVDKFVADSAGYGTYTHRTSGSISTTGTTVSYTFRANTYKEVLDKTLELMPSNWYYRVGLGDNTVFYRERSTTPMHLFYLGKHIKELDLKGSILDSTNRVLFTGGGDPALFINREEVPANRVRRTLEIMSDARVTLTSSAEIIADGRIEQNNKQLYRTTVEILSVQYDIESIEVGQTVGFRNFGNYADSLVMQIVGLSYSPDSVQLVLDTKPPTINNRLEDIRRNLTITDNANVPNTPS